MQKIYRGKKTEKTRTVLLSIELNNIIYTHFTINLGNFKFLNFDMILIIEFQLYLQNQQFYGF